jgi:hypothetical protein
MKNEHLLQPEDRIQLAACNAELDARWLAFAQHRAACEDRPMPDRLYWAAKARKIKREIVAAARKIEALLAGEVLPA